MEEVVPLACVPGAIPAAERPAHRRLTHALFSTGLQQRLELADGIAFRFPVEALEDVERFVTNERKCCPFADFEIRLSAADQAVWLKVTGPEGTREVIEAEIGAA